MPALLQVYGPLPRLTPWGMETPDELVAALARDDGRYMHLSAWDLRRVDNLITEASLQALCTALPNLCSLRLHSSAYPIGCTDLTAASFAAATSQHRHLTALHMPFISYGMGNDPLPEWPIEGCAHLRELTLPGALVRAPCSTALSRLTGLSKLRSSVGFAAGIPHIASLVAQLPALVALEVELELQADAHAVAQLRSLTRLTRLALTGCIAEQGTTAGQLLQHVGSLANLRSLELYLDLDQYTAEPLWLTRLTLLTGLRVILNTPDGAAMGGLALAFNEVASSVPHLPALRALHMFTVSGGACATLSAAACARIASSRSTLRLLNLVQMALPAAMFTEVLPQLTGLTCLRLDCVITPPPFSPTIASFSWLAGLTALRELSCAGSIRHNAELDAFDCCVLPCQLLGTLSRVDTLRLLSCAFLDGDYLDQLCESMPQLRHLIMSLNMGGSKALAAGLTALQHLTSLEVLGLALEDVSLEHVRAPLSLRRCYMGHVGSHEKRAETRAALGRQVDVVFAYWDPDARQG
jgi:hypothetical protein